MERNEAIRVTGLEEYNIYERFSDGPVWTTLASSPIHAMDLYCHHVDHGYCGYSSALEQGETESMSLIGDTVWGVFENTEIYAERVNAPEPRTMPVNDETIEDVLKDASDSFWARVAECFPTAETGDLDPLTTVRLEEAQRSAVNEWVAANVKKHYVAVVFDVTGMDDISAGHVIAEAQVQGESNEYHPNVLSCTIQTTTEGGTMDDFLDDLPAGWGEF